MGKNIAVRGLVMPLFLPAKTHHELTCDAGAPCVLLTRRGGPPDYNFVTP